MDSIGQSGCLASWFREWQQPLRRFLVRRRVGPAADVDDIAQEVFLRLLRYDRADLVKQPLAYLFTIASNVAAEWAMRANRRMPHDSTWLDELVDPLSPECVHEEHASGESVREALQRLPPRARHIMLLHFHEEMTQPEIARALGVSRKIVKRDTARAYADLRSRLESHAPPHRASAESGRP